MAGKFGFENDEEGYSSGKYICGGNRYNTNKH